MLFLPKVGVPLTSSTDLKSANLRFFNFLLFADFPLLWKLADLPCADLISFCGLTAAGYLQILTNEIFKCNFLHRIIPSMQVSVPGPHGSAFFVSCWIRIRIQIQLYELHLNDENIYIFVKMYFFTFFS
jgi:hypothetical protein